MKESEWYGKNRTEIARLIVDHNMGIDPTPEIKRRVYNHLMAMPVKEFFAHIMSVYNGILYEPEVTKVDPFEARRREREYEKFTIKHTPKIVDVQVKVVLKEDEYDTAENDLYGKSCSLNVFRAYDSIAVLVKKGYKSKMDRYIAKHYPGMDIMVMEAKG